MRRSLTLACLSAVALCATAVPAFSQDVETRSQVVRFGDLDIYSDAGADVLLTRIDRAARNVCYEGGVAQLTARSDIRDCEHEATVNAVADVGSSVVTARYYGVTPEVIVGEGDAYVDPDASITVYKKPA